jgi:hypothetical protein
VAGPGDKRQKPHRGGSRHHALTRHLRQADPPQ